MAAPLVNAPALPPPVRLYRHALESVFAFFTLPELPKLLAVSHEWQSAVLSMKSLGVWVHSAKIKLYANPLDCLTAVCNSRLRRHIRRLFWYSFAMHPSALHMLSRSLLQLDELGVRLAVSDEPPSFPAKLLKLQFRLQSQKEDEEDAARIAFFNHTMDAIGNLQLLTDLSINDKLPAGVSLSALTRLPQLRRLHIECGRYEWSDAQVAELRSLIDLELVGMWGAELPLLSRVLAQPHSLRWKELDGHDDLTAPMMQLLKTLPLTSLEANLAMAHIDQLDQQHLPHLTELDLLSSDRVPLDRPRIFNTLSSLVQLSSLSLYDSDDANGFHFTDADLRGALRRLTQLRSLVIQGATQIASLSFLSGGALGHSLTILNLSLFHRRVPVAELKYVLPLAKLQSLRLCDVFDAPIGEACELPFKPPLRECTFPSLQTFQHSWTEPPEEQ